MQQITDDRRISSRRNGRHGGRRATDQPVNSLTIPVCPCCGLASTILAGEAEGGWWFLCDSCDHLWNQRCHAIPSIAQKETLVRGSPAES